MKGRFWGPFFWSVLPFAAVMMVIELVVAGSGPTDALVTAVISGAMLGASPRVRGNLLQNGRDRFLS